MKTTKNDKYINRIQGERVRECIEKFGLTSKYVAKKLNYTPQHISYIINGKRNLTLEMAIALADLFSKHNGYEETNVYIPPNSEVANPYVDTEEGTFLSQMPDPALQVDYKYLLGERDYMFVWDNFEPSLDRTPDYLFKEGLKSILHHHGYDITINMCPDITCFKNVKKNDPLNQVICQAFFNQDYYNEITNVSTGECLQLTPGELYQLFQDFISAILNITERKFEQQRWEDALKGNNISDNEIG